MIADKRELVDYIFDEISGILPTKTCCQKAYILGLLYNCRRNGESKEYVAFLKRECDAERAVRMLNLGFSSGADITPRVASKGGHKGYDIDFSSKALVRFFNDIDSGRIDDTRKALGFRCDDCAANFIRGVFLSSSSMSIPKNGYRLEFSFTDANRADVVAKLIGEEGAEMSRTERNGKTVLYYRSYVKISDFLYKLGALRGGFELAELSMMREEINYVNRTTNCDARNIERAVGASRKHIDAINYIIERDKMALLDDELQTTARLRIENDDISLSALAALHDPPITKSGVNGRLTKILMVAEELRKS